MRRIVVIFLLLNLIMLASNVLLDPGSLLQSVKIKSGVSDERKIANILAQGGTHGCQAQKSVLTKGRPEFFSWRRSSSPQRV